MNVRQFLSATQLERKKDFILPFNCFKHQLNEGQNTGTITQLINAKEIKFIFPQHFPFSFWIDLFLFSGIDLLTNSLLIYHCRYHLPM